MTAEVSQTDTEITNVSKLIAITKKYTRINELTPKPPNAFVNKSVVHESENKDGKGTQAIDIYIHVGIVTIPTDEETREMEREYMRRTHKYAQRQEKICTPAHTYFFILIWLNPYNTQNSSENFLIIQLNNA